jgi:hypothetical protein
VKEPVGAASYAGGLEILSRYGPAVEFGSVVDAPISRVRHAAVMLAAASNGTRYTTTVDLTSSITETERSESNFSVYCSPIDVNITVEHKTNDADTGTTTTYTDVIPTLCSFDSGTGNLNMYHKSGQSMVYPDNHNKITDMEITANTKVVVTIITTKSNLDATIAGTPA